jgi:Copper transport outer membrane protein, MctB
VGYSSRYHVASLVAVFVALAIGILIGAALGSDVISGAADRLEEDLSEDLDQVRAENSALQEELEFEERFSARLAPVVMANRLAAQEVGLIGLGDIDTATLRDDLNGALAPAGARLTQVGSLREPPDSEALIDALLTDEERSAPQDEQFGLAAERAGRLLAGRGALEAEILEPLMSEYSGNPEGLDSVVLARARPEDLSAREEADMDVLETGVINGLRNAGVRVVGAEREDTEPSSIEYFDEQGLATVDSIDQLPGKVALVLALDGAEGNFGVKETADSLMPDLIEPSPTVGANG